MKKCIYLQSGNSCKLKPQSNTKNLFLFDLYWTLLLMPKIIDISNEEIMGMIANSLQLSLKQVSTTLELLNEGNTVPFIARYRKERTNSLDETQIRKIEEQYEEDTQLIKEKNKILESLNEQGKLTKELEESITKATTLAELREIYRPYKQKKKT